MAAAAALSAPALRALAAGAPVLLLSADARGRPQATYSWAVALSARRLRAAVDRGGRTSSNWRRQGQAGIQVVGTAGLNLLIHGRPVRLAAALACAPTMELWDLAVQRVTDQSWPGVATSELRYRWPAARRTAMRRFERTLCRQLRETPGRGRF
jgi:hypothetical protein